MNKAILHFSDKSILEVKEGDCLIPIVLNDLSGDVSASMDKSAELWTHINNGLIPSLMDVFIKCDFFYLNHDYNFVYNSKAVVKIELA